ncbi:VWA domain-containing protein [Natrinema gelatinilyticum]|uniref:VWA domain-containing protein n=1 Tax=Natrinema gelatinilyticum TaxID=2961571 RepID=UPI0020C4C69A|nr:VWA domain-containing protein [Natrinema gelatinilyticum]
MSTDHAIAGAAAISEIDPLERDQFYYALKSTLLDDQAHRPIFDDLFVEYWDELSSEAEPDRDRPNSGDVDVEETIADEDSSVEDGDEPTDVPAEQPPHSSGTPDVSNLPDGRTNDHEGGSDKRRGEADEEVALEIGQQDRATLPAVSFTGDDLAAETLSLLVKDLGWQLGTIRGFESNRDQSGDLDLRRSLNAAREPHPGNLPRISKERSQVRVRFFVDVSHSMLRNMDREFLLLFLFECMRQYVDVRTFFFDTKSTEVTRYFQSADIGRTIEEMRRARTEWGAGTTIGACLEEILTVDPFIVDHDTIVVVISDGWDAGDLERLREQLHELTRRSQSIIWLNPLATSPNYEPKVSGMETALPYVDHFFGFADVDDLREVVDELRSRA